MRDGTAGDRAAVLVESLTLEPDDRQAASSADPPAADGQNLGTGASAFVGRWRGRILVAVLARSRHLDLLALLGMFGPAWSG